MDESWNTEFIPVGQSLVEQELAIVQDELDAFETFYRRVDEIEATQIDADSSPASVPVMPVSSMMAQIRDAYRSTVMDTSHYDAEYGDTVDASFEDEFGAIGAGITENNVFTPELKTLLLRSCQETIDRRTKLKNALELEYSTLERTNQELTEIGTRILLAPASSLQGPEVAELRSQCNELARNRQRQLRSRRTFDGETLQQYLYSSQPFTYAVLSDIALVGELLRSICPHRAEWGADQ